MAKDLVFETRSLLFILLFVCPPRGRSARPARRPRRRRDRSRPRRLPGRLLRTKASRHRLPGRRRARCRCRRGTRRHW